MIVCMLLIATIVPAVGSQNSRIMIPMTSNSIAQQTSLENWTEIQKLLASDGATGDKFGYSVSLDNDTALIGAHFDDNRGSAYVFTHTGTTWTQQTKLLASDGAAYDYFGCSVSLDDNTALIGALNDESGFGSVYVFTRTGTTWTQQQRLFASDGSIGDNFGCSVSLSDNTALIGAVYGDGVEQNTGTAYVFTRTGTIWTQQAKLLALDGATVDNFGISVSLNNGTALIGAPFDDSSRGSAYVFTLTGTTWTQQAKLFALDGATGNWFGYSVSLDGDTALIGTPANESTYVFTRTGTTWTQEAKLIPSDGTIGFGYSVCLEFDTALIGAKTDDDNGVWSGSAYVFAHTGTTWMQQQKLLASDGTAYDWFGISVSLSGDTALIGAWGDDDNGNESGSAYIFTREGGTPNLQIDITTQGIGVDAAITNNGIVNATGVEWQIHVEGGIFGYINTTVDGTIDVPMGETRTVTTGLFLGLGPFTIIVKANDKEKTATGIILLFYVLGIT